MKGNNDMNEKKKIKMKYAIKILEYLKNFISNYKGVYEIPDVTGREPYNRGFSLESYTIGFSDGADAIVEKIIEDMEELCKKNGYMLNWTQQDCESFHGPFLTNSRKEI
jgi:hypothetical protein